MLKKIRICLAAVVFAAFLCAFIGIGGRLEFLARWQLVPAILALNVVALATLGVLTLLLGRVYCSVFCPLGIFQDIVLWIRRRFGKKKFQYETPWSKTRWAILASCVVAVLVGFLALPALIDPYSIFGRMASALLQPLAFAVKNAVAYLTDLAGTPMVMKEEIFVKGALAMAVAGGSFIVMAFLAAQWGRFYCNAICPAGTILSVLSHRPLLQLKVDKDKCIGCGMCAMECKARCIDFTNHRIDNARCVRCFNCLTVCKKGAIKL